MTISVKKRLPQIAGIIWESANSGAFFLPLNLIVQISHFFSSLNDKSSKVNYYGLCFAIKS